MSSFLLAIVLFSYQGLLSAQQMVGNGTDCDKSEICTEVSSCIETYHDLDLYIRGNTMIKESLTRVFF